MSAGRSLTRKLIDEHLVAGKPSVGEEIGIAVDQILLTDTNGIQSWLQFEAMGFGGVKPGRVVTYIDHNVYQFDSRNSYSSNGRVALAPHRDSDHQPYRKRAECGNRVDEFRYCPAGDGDECCGKQRDKQQGNYCHPLSLPSCPTSMESKFSLMR